MEWYSVNFNTMNNDEIYSIVKELRKSNNNPVTINGITYKFDNGTLVCSAVAVNEIPEVKEEKVNTPVNTRKTILMAKIINANNLASIFEGNFYPIVEWDGNYITIKDDNGDKFIIRKNRIKEINVYQEKPE